MERDARFPILAAGRLILRLLLDFLDLVSVADEFDGVCCARERFGEGSGNILLVRTWHSMIQYGAQHLDILPFLHVSPAGRPRPTWQQTGTMTDDNLLYLEAMTGASVAEAGLLEMKLSEKSEVEAAAAAVGVWLVLNKRWAFTLCRRNGILTRA